MKKYIFLLLLSLSPAMLFATETDFSDFPQIDGWKITVSDEVYVPDNLWNFMNGGADLYLKYGFIDLHLADYTNSDGITIQAEVYAHSSAINAYGIYSMERSPDYQFIGPAGQAYIGDGILNFVSGVYYVKLVSMDEAANLPEALKKVGNSIIEALGQETNVPELLSVFPETGQLAHTEKYIAKKFLGNDFLYNAYSTDYEDGHTLFLIDGANTKEIVKMATSYLEFTKQNEDLVINAPFVIADPYNGDIPVIIVDHYLLGILNGTGSQNAKSDLEKLCENINSVNK